MKIKHKSELLSCISKKCEKLSEYDAITEKLIEAQFDDIAKHFADRQVLINSINDLSEKINSIVSEQSDEVKANLKRIITFKDVEPSELYKDVTDKLEEMKKILVGISEKEKKVGQHLESLKFELVDDMKKSTESKKIIDLFKTVGSSHKNGGKLNVLK